VPGLIKYKFKWAPLIDFKDAALQKVLRLMGPRLVSIAFIQLIFLARDNLASRLSVGSVTALSYGWWIQQVPETLIGTAIATALLPTLSEHVAAGKELAFKQTVERSLRVMIALSLPITVLLSLTSLPLIQTAFGFPLADARMILWATQGYLVGLLGHMVVELGVRAFYAKQSAKIPMLVSGLGFLLYLGFAIALMGSLASGGIALANSLSYTIQAGVLLVLLNRHVPERFQLGGSMFRGMLALAASGLTAWLIMTVLPIPLSPLFLSIAAIGFGGIIGALPIWRDIQLLVEL
jgi:putative peptidoglycan lipid II flippase